MAENAFYQKKQNIWKIFMDCLLPAFSTLLSTLSIPGLILLYLYRFLVWVVVRFSRPDLDSFIVGLAAAYVSKRPDNVRSFSNIMMGLVVERDLSSEKLRSLFQERVLNLCDSKGNLIYKRLRQCWTYFMGYAFWKKEGKNFNLQNHIRDYDYAGELHLPKCSDENDLERIWPKLAETPWKDGQSTWEFLVVRNFSRRDQSETTHTLLIFRVDHIQCDVYSIIGLFRALFKSPFTTPKPYRNYAKLGIWDFFKSILMLSSAFNMYLVMMIRGRTLRERSIKNGNNLLHYSFTKNLPLEKIKSLKKKYQVEFASVVHSAIHGAIARAMRESGQIPPSNLDLMYVLPLPDHPGGWKVHKSVIETMLPCERNSWMERLMETNRILKTYDHSLLPFSLNYSIELISRLPSKLLFSYSSFLMKRGPSFLMSNFPVILSRDYVEGREIVDVFTALTVSNSMGMVISSWGVNSQQRFNFLLDKSIFGDEIAPEKISTFFEEELESMDKQIMI